MEHVAIMKKSWGLLPKILSGDKTIESRWYMHRVAPWNRVQAGDTVYFKNSGELITARAQVQSVLQFADLTPERVYDILAQCGSADGLTSEMLPAFEHMFKDKKYCILIFLERAAPVRPFTIDKQGYGAMAAWLCLPHPTT